MIIINKILIVAIMTLWMSAANASLIFDFEIDDGVNNFSATISGLIDNTLGQEAVITVNENSYGWSEGSVFDDVISINLFDVINAEIVGAEFTGRSVSNGFTVELQISMNQQPFSINVYDVNGNGTLLGQFSPVATMSVPVPHTSVLLLLGLAGLGFSRYKKQQ